MQNKKLTLKQILKSEPVANVTEVSLTGGVFKEVVIKVKNKLSLVSALSFVRDVAMTCVDADLAEYMPEFFDFAVRLYTLLYYADIDMTKHVEKAYSVLYFTDLFDRVSSQIDSQQYSALEDAAYERIEHMKKLIESSAASKVDALVAKMDEVVSGGQEALDALNGDGFKNALKTMEALAATGVETGSVDESSDGASETNTEANSNIVHMKRKNH